MQNDNELYHYGILGMKWGRRKGSSTISRTTQKERSEDYQNSRSIQRKSISEMSNKELETLTRRLQLEKQYKDLTPSQVSKGKQTVNKMLKTAKTVNEIYALYNSPIGKALKKSLTKK